MYRTLSLTVAVAGLVLLAGCKNCAEYQKTITSLENQLQRCAMERNDLKVEVSQLGESYDAQRDQLAAAQEGERALNELLADLEGEAQAREERLVKLKKLVENIQGMTVDSRPEGDVIIIDNNILFDAGKIDLSQTARQMLDSTVVAYIRDDVRAHPNQQIRIDGHTDGEPIRHSNWQSNHHLASMRAHAVMKHLASRGIPSVNMYIAGFGPNRPKVTPPTPTAAMPENRRVEILLVRPPRRSIEEILEGMR